MTTRDTDSAIGLLAMGVVTAGSKLAVPQALLNDPPIPTKAKNRQIHAALLGGLAARAGGERVAMGAIRVTFWGALAMVVTAAVVWLFATVA